ncbi:MAG: flavodoxin family protein [Methanosarcina sp.]|jgi:multimeric flavodoxin WrbA|nr:flavodoxin family protein [Methanosarcina sp.]MDD3874635.1 flavodoxin family protein [Methanosarcina sp.]MDD4523690.1 flavodoxin family protein [Methanosarcina sp.]HHV23604.1 flavodoxin family protein [Methanosarcina sp.]
MKIVGIQSSPRGKNSNTLKLLNAALDGASKAGAEVESIDIAKLKIKYCTACNTCHETGECTIKDDYEMVLKKLLTADGIVLSSPNYITNVTAQLKTMFDRSPLVIHEQLFEGKYSLSLTTAGSDELDFVLGIMDNFIVHCGGKTIGGVGCSVARGPEAMEEAIIKSREMGKDLVEAIKEKRQYPEQEARHEAWRERFKYVVLANKDQWTHNCDYWMEKGWLKE